METCAAGFRGVFLIDAVEGLRLPGEARALVHGDALSYMIGAASIVAKVARDRYMIELDAKYPMYGFARNKGYGTAEQMCIRDSCFSGRRHVGWRWQAYSMDFAPHVSGGAARAQLEARAGEVRQIYLCADRVLLETPNGLTPGAAEALGPCLMVGAAQAFTYAQTCLLYTSGVLGIFEQAGGEALVLAGLGAAEHAGHQPRHGVDHHQRAQLAAGEHIVADGQFLVDAQVECALVDALVVAAEQQQPRLAREFLDDALVELPPARGEVDAPGAVRCVSETARKQLMSTA